MKSVVQYKSQVNNMGKKVTSLCPECKKSFSYYPSAYKGGIKVHCSRECQKKASRITTNCPNCGKEFWYHKSWTRKYCSRECSAKVNIKRQLGNFADGEPPREVSCDLCGTLFEKSAYEINKTDHHFCSQECFGKFLSKTRIGIPRPELRGERPNLHKRVSLVCPQCGKNFQVKLSQAERRVFCSRKCLSDNGRVEKQCEFCGKFFRAKKSVVRIGKGKFCSQKCHSEYQKTLIGPKSIKYKKPISLICNQCGKKYDVKPHREITSNFCSQDCYTRFQDKKIKALCDNCGQTYYVKRSEYESSANHFCSQVCLTDWRVGENNPAWRGGFDPYYGPNWRQQRRNVRRRDNYTCQNCGITEAELERNLDVHHLIPFRMFGIDRYKEANHLSNLISLCRNCHVKIETRLKVS